jgi:hypothetical protein
MRDAAYFLRRRAQDSLVIHLVHRIKKAIASSIAASSGAIASLLRLRRITSANGPSALGQRKKDANQRLEELERWSARATLLIFFGIIVDLAVVLYVPHDRSEIIGAVIANGLIGLGLIIEYIVILRAIKASGEAQRESNEKVAEANIRAAEANQRAQEAILETARLRASARANLVAIQSTRTVSEVIAVAQGLAIRGSVSEAARSVYIISKITPFAGKQFDAVVASTDVELEVFLLYLTQALKAAGWIEVNRSGDDAIPYGAGAKAALVKIDVDANKLSELWEAAEALASALKDEGIEALASSMPDTSNADAIHILISAKAL